MPFSDAVTDDSSSESSPPTPPPRQFAQRPLLDSDQRLRRSFYIRLRQRAQSRSDHPQYELVHVVGHLRVPPSRPSSSTSRKYFHSVFNVRVTHDREIKFLSYIHQLLQLFLCNPLYSLAHNITCIGSLTYANEYLSLSGLRQWVFGKYSSGKPLVVKLRLKVIGL